jgi:hypothetical protein
VITFFTTFRKYGIPEQNAVGSWLATAPQAEVIVFTESPDAPSWGLPASVVISKTFRQHETGLPLLNTIFAEASRIASNNLLCYCNSDIILTADFVARVRPLLKERRSFLAVSQRVDLDVDERIDFKKQDWHDKLKQQAEKQGTLHPPLGSDIFIFPRFQYNEDNMPALVVGRPCWDNWMFYNARLRFNRLINFTDTGPVVYHQNHPQNYNSTNERDQINVQFLPGGHQYTFVLDYCNYTIRNGAILKSGVERKDVTRINYELIFNKDTAAYYYFWILLFVEKVKYKLSH